jgi:dihydrofolate reductase
LIGMKCQYYTAATLDGFLATPDHSLDWLFQFGEGPMVDYPAFINAVGAIAMGSHTYEWLLRHEIAPPDKPGKPWFYAQPSWVFTTRDLPRVPNADVRFCKGDVRRVHAEMAGAASGKNLWIVGGGDLVGQFHDHGLIDELIVSIASVTIGAGAPLLPRMISMPPLALRHVKQYGTDFVTLTYDVPGRASSPEPGTRVAG